jgi:hypothetical protein
MLYFYKKIIMVVFYLIFYLLFGFIWLNFVRKYVCFVEMLKSISMVCFWPVYLTIHLIGFLF